MRNSRPILSYKGVNVYESFKGGRGLTYLYALVPDYQAEGHGDFPDLSVLPSGYVPGFQIGGLSKTGWNGRIFDVRELPKKYKAGLLVEDKSKHSVQGGAFFQRLRAEHEAHIEAIRRAIDDGFDLRSGKRKGSDSWLSRLTFIFFRPKS